MSYREHDFEVNPALRSACVFSWLMPMKVSCFLYFSQDPFDPVDFVEHLMQSVISKQRRKEVLEDVSASRPKGQGGQGPPADDGFDPQTLLSVFDDTLYELGGLSERVERRVEKLMKVIQKEERETKAGVTTVEKAFEVSLDSL